MKFFCLFCKAEIFPFGDDDSGYKVQCAECMGSIDFDINIKPLKKEDKSK